MKLPSGDSHAVRQGKIDFKKKTMLDTWSMRLKSPFFLWAPFLSLSFLLWFVEYAIYLPQYRDFLEALRILDALLAASVLARIGARRWSVVGFVLAVAGVGVSWFLGLWVLAFLNVLLAFGMVLFSGVKRWSIVTIILGLFAGQAGFLASVLTLTQWTLGKWFFGTGFAP